MKRWDKIKAGLDKGSKKIIEVTDKLVGKGKVSGSEGLETAKELFSQIGGKTSEVASVVKIKFEMGSLQKNLDLESLTLGKLLLKRHQTGNTVAENDPILKQFEKMLELEQQIQSKREEYDRLRKTLSDDYIVNKLSDDLSASGAVIDQVIVSGKSNVVYKRLKEIVLPKEALISAIKRGEAVIIPDGNTKLQAGDQVTIIGKTGDVEKVAKRLNAS